LSAMADCDGAGCEAGCEVGFGAVAVFCAPAGAARNAHANDRTMHTAAVFITIPLSISRGRASRCRRLRSLDLVLVDAVFLELALQSEPRDAEELGGFRLVTARPPESLGDLARFDRLDQLVQVVEARLNAHQELDLLVDVGRHVRLVDRLS